MPSDTLPLALEETQGGTTRIALGPRAVVLRGFVASWAAELVAAIDGLAAVSPFGHMVTPGGWEMLVALSDCPRWVEERTRFAGEVYGGDGESAWTP